MALKGKIDKSESYRHAIIKMLVYYILRSKKHMVSMEYKLTGGIIDVIDQTEGYAYEPYNILTAAQKKEKIETYLKVTNDVIFIPLKEFSLDEPIKNWIIKLEKYLVY